MKFADAPRLPTLPFILGDIALLLLAGVIAAHHPNPLAPLPLLTISGCVALGALASFIPFLVNNARDQEEAGTALRHELGEQFKRLMTASDHLQHSTVQLKTIEEIATKNLQSAEKLPYRLQEKIAEFNQQLAEAENDEKEALEQELAALRAGESGRLAAVTDKVVKATAEWTKLEAEMRRQSADAAQLEQKLLQVLAAIEAKIAAFETAVRKADRPSTTRPPLAIPAPPPPADVPPKAAAPTAPIPAAKPKTTTPVPEVVAAPAAAAVATAAQEPVAADASKSVQKSHAPWKQKYEKPSTAKPDTTPPLPVPAAEPAKSATVPALPVPVAEAAKSKTTPPVPAPAAAPAKPKTAPSLPAPSAKSAAPVELIAEPVADEPPAPENFSQIPTDEGKPAPSGDGLTRLTVISYVGIGNKLYLRGEGPGLNWDKGVPLQFVSIGRWRWETAGATAPVKIKIYKNDKIEAPGGPLTLAPGTEREIETAF